MKNAHYLICADHRVCWSCRKKLLCLIGNSRKNLEIFCKALRHFGNFSTRVNQCSEITALVNKIEVSLGLTLHFLSFLTAFFKSCLRKVFWKQISRCICFDSIQSYHCFLKKENFSYFRYVLTILYSHQTPFNKIHRH